MMTEQEFVRIASFVKNKYGIDMKKKKAIVEGRLENYVKAGGWTTYTSYMDAVTKDKTGSLEKKLIDLLSTNHTYFMRESEHFDFLRSDVLPWLKEKEKNNKDLHIWCAASSSGEEPYTLAMVLMDFFGLEHNKWDTQILATDVSTEILQQAINGIYTREQIEPLPEHWKRRFFRNVSGSENYRVTEELRKQVMFRKFNLMDPFPFRKKLHVVFIRNVMIYFDDATKKELLQKIYDHMEVGGYLFLGKTETINRESIPFQLVTPSIFRK